MNSSSFPIEAATVLVADASVVINLNATGCAHDILWAQPGAVVVTENAFIELAAVTRYGHSDSEKLQALIHCGVVRLVQLGETGSRVYASLVEGPARRTLDDGEAATIGCACEAGGVAMIDERKARTLCADRFPNLMMASTADLLIQDRVKAVLGEQGQIDAILKALRSARMRVAPHQIETVVKLIGDGAAATCNSLPQARRAAS